MPELPFVLTAWGRAALEEIIQQVNHIAQFEHSVTIEISKFRAIGSCDVAIS